MEAVPVETAQAVINPIPVTAVQAEADHIPVPVAAAQGLARTAVHQSPYNLHPKPRLPPLLRHHLRNLPQGETVGETKASQARMDEGALEADEAVVGAEERRMQMSSQQLQIHNQISSSDVQMKMCTAVAAAAATVRVNKAAATPANQPQAAANLLLSNMNHGYHPIAARNHRRNALRRTRNDCEN